MSQSRILSPLAAEAGASAIDALTQLANLELTPEAYGQAMREVGFALGRCFARDNAVAGQSVYLAVTVEDADFLASGIAKALEQAGAKTAVACFWNVRRKAGGYKWLDVATIVDEYREPIPADLTHLIVVKSIISGACVVKTNLMHLLEDADPEQIHIMAPVVLKGAEERLASEFDADLASRFRYWLLATDDTKDEHGNVLPGIGGEIYGRLGFDGQRGKNAHYPAFIKERVLALT
ncbi:hypothetical protein ACYZX9_11390 [Sphingomonas citri]